MLFRHFRAPQDRPFRSASPILFITVWPRVVEWQRFSALAEHWRDESTRNLLIWLADRANCLAGSRAVEALALFWRDDATRRQLISFAENSEDSDGKSMAVMSLMKYQRDEETRQFLISLVQSSPDSLSGCTAVQALADYWRDQTTRQLLTALVPSDRDSTPNKVRNIPGAEPQDSAANDSTAALASQLSSHFSINEFRRRRVSSLRQCLARESTESSAPVSAPFLASETRN